MLFALSVIVHTIFYPNASICVPPVKQSFKDEKAEEAGKDCSKIKASSQAGVTRLKTVDRSSKRDQEKYGISP